MPDEVNPHGTIFGGVVMSWIDKIAYMCAQNFAECKKTVTANIDQIQFINPIFAGDHVIIKALVVSVGRSSMEIDVTLFKEDPIRRDSLCVGSAHLTFVALDKKNRPKMVPILLCETNEEKIRHHNAQSRINMRKELKKNYAENKEFIEASGPAVIITSYESDFSMKLLGRIKRNKDLIYGKLPKVF